MDGWHPHSFGIRFFRDEGKRMRRDDFHIGKRMRMNESEFLIGMRMKREDEDEFFLGRRMKGMNPLLV